MFRIKSGGILAFLLNEIMGLAELREGDKKGRHKARLLAHV
jgi:hypothetical protein